MLLAYGGSRLTRSPFYLCEEPVHNRIAIAERAIVAFVKEFQWIRDSATLKRDLFTIPPKFILHLKQKTPVIT